MPLKPGTMLGPYEILSLIGAGGMGEVYKGRDTRLERIVALKVLPAHLAGDPERRERFEREARAIANLQHPNICVLYDIGEQDGIPGQPGRVFYLVMEYLDGETLAQRLMKGPLPLEQVLKYGAEVSDALDKAHRQGFTHRDIKPGNIMLTKAGSKILDFGLAKLKQEAARPNLPQSQIPTAPSGLTADGQILGTLHYMAPEQVEGKVDDIDGRTDIFAFGAVVYEMLTGKKAFEGKSSASVIAKILEVDPPPMSSLQPMTPPLLDSAIKRCLAKDPDDRWQNANDLTFQLKWIAQAGSQAMMPTLVSARRKLRERLGWIVGAASLLALLGTLAMVVPRLRSTPSAGPAIRFTVPPPENTDFSGGTSSGPNPALSPDGLRVAFIATGHSGGPAGIWIHSFDSLTARMLPGTEGAVNTTLPFWSPDGRYIGFFADGKLKKMDVSGGPPLVLCDAPVSTNAGGGAWNREGIILFSRFGGLFQVSASGGEAKAVTKVDESRGESGHVLPQFLPDGRHFLYVVRGAKPEIAGTYLGSLESSEPVRLLDANVKVEYAQGHVLFLRGRTLLAQPFDASRLQLTGEPVPVAEQVGVGTASGRAAFSASENGTLVFGPGTAIESAKLQWYDHGGKPLQVIGPPARYFDPELSLDGKRVAVERTDPQDGTGDIWLLETARDVASRFTFDPTPDGNANWSPDGGQIIFRSNRSGLNDLYRKASSGVAKEEVLLQSNANKYSLDWSSDGRFLVYGADASGGLDLWVLPLEGDKKPFVFLQSQFNEDHAQFSPDGRWLAYISNESGRYEVYIQSFPKAGGKWQVSTGGGLQPRWRRDGRELYYIAPDQKLMAVAVRGEAALEVSQPVTLFQTQIFESGAYVSTDKQQYDVTSDGQRFLMVKPTEQAAAATQIHVVLNWFEELKRKVPVR